MKKNEKNDYVVSLNMGSLVDKKKQINEKYNELIEMFKNYQKKLDATKEFYDTAGANYFRKVADEYMNLSLVKLEMEVEAHLTIIENTIKAYQNFENSIASIVNKENTNGTL